jgi:hypothetical protein
VQLLLPGRRRDGPGIGEFCRKISGIAPMRSGWQKNVKNRDSVLTRFGKSLIVPPAIRLLTSVR